jgi:glyoxylase-like metal-dependent hydrolase (beta-lactamase superfamily II)
MEILPNVHWLDGGASNLYLCVDEDGLTLVDTGMPKRLGLVFDAIQEIGRQPSDLARILITHADIDHAGSAAAIQEQTDATLYAGPETAELLVKGKSPQHMPWLIQFFIDRFVSYRAIPANSIGIFQDGEELPVLGGLQVLATPGHTHDHYSFYSPAAGILFAGDALNTRDDRLRSTPKRITADGEAAIHSAIRLIQLSPAVIACGHGTPMSEHSSDDLMNLFNELRKGPP